MNLIARTIAAGVALAAAATAGTAIAQDFNANPNYGTIQLNNGFTPDPQVINLQSGGNINVSNVINGCLGYITNAPDVRLHYNAGGGWPLIISVASNADTTLVVNAPDGQWYCDDDGGAYGLNPSLRFNTPMSGRYEIWVGTYGSATLQPAQLHISEVQSQ